MFIVFFLKIDFLPATIMLPPRRLQSLLNQAIEFQKERCPYHNIKVENGLDDFSLLVDHLCCKYVLFINIFIPDFIYPIFFKG